MASGSGFTNSAVATGTYTIGTPAPIAFVQGTYAVPSTPQSSVPVTYAGTQTAGNSNIVAVGWSDGTSTVNSVTDAKGNTYSLAIGPTRQGGIQSQAIYVASNIAAAAAGTNTVTVAFNAAVPYADVRVLEYSGLAPSNSLDGSVGAVGTGTTSNSGSFTTINANGLLFAANYVSSHSSSAGTGFTSRVITSPDGDIAEDRVVGAAGTFSATAGMTSGNWVMQLIALKGNTGGLAAAASPTFSPAQGTYSTTQNVSLLDATPGATIYYTLNGTAPTTASAVYKSPIQVTATTTIKAMAAASGLVNSSVTTSLYTIPQGLATPTLNPSPGIYSTAQSVTLQDATPGATIYYTLNGTTPTTSSAVYSSPIPVTATTTISAMAAAPGFANSAVATGSYSIGTSVPIAFVQVNSAVPSTPQSTVAATYTKAQVAGNTNIVAIGWSNSTSTLTSVTDSRGNAYSLAAGPTITSGIQSQVIYIAKNIAAGTNTVTVKFSTAVPFPDVRILEYSGIDTVSPLDVVAGASGSSITSSSGPVTTTNAYDLIFAANYVSTTTNAAGSGFVNRIITNPDGDIAEDQIITKTGIYTGTAQLNTSGAWVMQAVALRGAGAPPSSDPSVIGQWSGITSWPILPVHATLMPTGKVLAWGHDATNSTTAATIWTPSTGTFQSTSYSSDLFCAGHGLLPDGRVFVAGGHNMADYHGLTSGAIFNPTTLAWSSAPAMTYGRWYPTVTALPDGRMLVSSGSINCDGCNATVPEIYDPKANTWSKLTTASLNIPIYPHMFVLPDGRVINTGSYELPIPTRALNISTQAWTTIDATVLDAGSAVMYLPGKILKTGTSANSSAPYKNSASTAYVLDMTQGAPAWRAVHAMALARTYHNSTVLPDGNVLITGGEGTTNPADQSTAARAAEMWSPVTENFTTMASMQTPRVYHSIALLLPDGRVLVGGSGEYGSGSIDQLNAEIYSPPYLFKGARPTVTSAPSSLTYGSQFAVQTPDAANISSVALLRLGSVTHAFNENQRYVPLTFSPSVGSLNVQAPANGNTAPPGYYMLFLVNSSGVPSVGAMVQFAAP
ncbi:MAG: chitobiase/beta-hexosaminidase C-terminal domain-containing protein [Terriglobales bacterium]